MARRFINESEIDRYLDESGEDSDFDDFSLSSDEDSHYSPSSGSESSSDDDSDMDTAQVSVAGPSSNALAAILSNDNGDDWTDTPDPNPLNFSFRENVGLNTDCSTVEDFVNLFFPEEFMQMLVEQTNVYASQTINQNGRVRRSSRMKAWTPTNVEEMKLFLGLLLHMGPFTLPCINLYWSTDILYQNTLWSSVMSRNKFQLLLRFLHFADNCLDSNDKLYKIRPILNHFNATMKNIYIPGKHVCIDESMMLWRGRLSFRQYIKNKKYKYGVKHYNLCESNGLIIKTKIYCGREEIIQNDIGHAADVVLHLMDNYFGKGYILYMDNFYNSVALTDVLSSKQTYVCGTLRSNRRGNPKEVVKQKLKKGEVTWKRKEHVTVCKWKDKRDVLTISNMHQVEMEEVRNRNGKVSVKPNIVIDYNNGMSGVDRSDQMLSYYSALRKTIRWPKKVALHLFEGMIHNAHIFYCHATSTKVKSLPFREKFVKCFLREKLPNSAERPRDTGPTQHYLETLPPTEKKERPTKACRICTKNKLRRETRYFCTVCEDQPPLCVVDCFKIHHAAI